MCKGKRVNFTLEYARVYVSLYIFFNLGARWGGWSIPGPGRFTPRKDPVPIV